ncbi:MAG: S-layer homology domain-containing protein [Promicromonosporaceae bacterium]|nr:S-layer homology domain-containing protein [Promicromonosporaceae bacterium]
MSKSEAQPGGSIAVWSIENDKEAMTRIKRTLRGSAVIAVAALLAVPAAHAVTASPVPASGGGSTLRVEFVPPSDWDNTIRIWAFDTVAPPNTTNFFLSFSDAPLMRYAGGGTFYWNFEPNHPAPMRVVFFDGTRQYPSGVGESVEIPTSTHVVANNPPHNNISTVERPVVYATPGFSSFTTPAGAETTLTAWGTATQEFRVEISISGQDHRMSGIPWTPFAEGDTVSFCQNARPGEQCRLTVRGRNTAGVVVDERSYEFTRIEANQPARIEFTHPSWPQVCIYAWNADTPVHTNLFTGLGWNDYAPQMNADGPGAWYKIVPVGTSMPIDAIFYQCGASHNDNRVPLAGGIVLHGSVLVEAGAGLPPGVTNRTPIFPDFGKSTVHVTVEDDSSVQVEVLPDNGYEYEVDDEGNLVITIPDRQCDPDVTVTIPGTWPAPGRDQDGNYCVVTVTPPPSREFYEDSDGNLRLRPTHAITAPATIGNRTDPAGTMIAPWALPAPTYVRPAGALTFSATGLPAGISLNSTTGQFTGTPTVVGPNTVTVTFRVSPTVSDTATFTWTIQVDPNSLPTGQPGTPSPTPPVNGGDTDVNVDVDEDGDVTIEIEPDDDYDVDVDDDGNLVITIPGRGCSDVNVTIPSEWDYNCVVVDGDTVVTVTPPPGYEFVQDDDGNVALRPIPPHRDWVCPSEASFSDVEYGSRFYCYIEWLAQTGITTGWPDGTFRPLLNIERQAMAAFMYRGLAAPGVFSAPGVPTFPDIVHGNDFHHHVEWMADTGITTGWQDGTFRPENGVERQAMAAFIYRAAGEPDFTPPSTPTFPDVPTNSPFFHEIEWMATTGITTGFDDGLFRPVQYVERQAMAAFMYRAFNNDGGHLDDTHLNRP